MYQDAAAARDFMVDGQVRPNKVIDPRIIRAMRTLPRERFVPRQAQSMAYVDEDVPLGGGRYLTEPMVIARLVQLARIREGDRVLIVGAGPGYGAALAAACGGQVTALEQDPALLAVARPLLAELAPGVTVAEGPLDQGLPGPWDTIIIDGAVRDIPPAIAALVPVGGRLVTVIDRDGAGQGVLAERGAPTAPLGHTASFSCATPMLRPLIPAPTFQF